MGQHPKLNNSVIAYLWLDILLAVQSSKDGWLYGFMDDDASANPCYHNDRT